MQACEEGLTFNSKDVMGMICNTTHGTSYTNN